MSLVTGGPARNRTEIKRFEASYAIRYTTEPQSTSCDAPKSRGTTGGGLRQLLEIWILLHQSRKGSLGWNLASALIEQSVDHGLRRDDLVKRNEVLGGLIRGGLVLLSDDLLGHLLTSLGQPARSC